MVKGLFSVFLLFSIFFFFFFFDGGSVYFKIESLRQFGQYLYEERILPSANEIESKRHPLFFFSPKWEHRAKMKRQGYTKVAPGATREKRAHEISPKKKVETSFLKGRISNIEPD